MAINPRLELRQGQTLTMTTQLQQAIKLLQLSNLELSEYVEQELEKNPFLERDVEEYSSSEEGDQSFPVDYPDGSRRRSWGFLCVCFDGIAWQS